MNNLTFRVLIIGLAAIMLVFSGCHKKLETVSLDHAANLNEATTWPSDQAVTDATQLPMLSSTTDSTQPPISPPTTDAAQPSMSPPTPNIAQSATSTTTTGAAATSPAVVSSPSPSNSLATPPPVVPSILRFIPENQKKYIFDELTLQSDKVLFFKEKTTETFAALNSDQTAIVALAQARSLGSPDGTVIILAGIRLTEGQPVMTRVFTFEYGQKLPRRNVYVSGKQRFLDQYTSRTIMGKTKKIDGITGATPLWKSISGEIDKMVQEMKGFAADSTFLASFRSRSLTWDRATPPPSTPVIASVSEAVPNPAPQPAIQNVVDPPVVTKSDTTTPDITPPSDVVKSDPAFPTPPQSPEISPANPADVPSESFSATLSADSDWPMTHWKAIGLIEINLLVLGLLIVLYNQLRKDRRI